MKIIFAEKAGFCFGVRRAVDTTRNASSKNKTYTFGPLIHNPQLIQKLEKEGVKVVNSLGEVESGTLVIRTHGVPPEVIRDAEKKHLNVVDATCPFVKVVQNHAKQLKKEGYSVVIIGEKDHPEVIAVNAYARNEARIIEEEKEAEGIPFTPKMGVVFQTTQEIEKVERIVSELMKKTKELRIYNTICAATSERQGSARKVAKEVEVMIVIGGKNSGNTRRLAEICSEIVKTHHIESAKELKKEWFKGKEKVGLTAGASTPDFLIEDAVAVLKKM